MKFTCRNQIISRTYIKVEWGQEEEAILYLKDKGFHIVNTNHREDSVIIVGERTESEDKGFIECRK